MSILATRQPTKTRFSGLGHVRVDKEGKVGYQYVDMRDNKLIGKWFTNKAEMLGGMMAFAEAHGFKTPYIQNTLKISLQLPMDMIEPLDRAAEAAGFRWENGKTSPRAGLIRHLVSEYLGMGIEDPHACQARERTGTPSKVHPTRQLPAMKERFAALGLSDEELEAADYEDLVQRDLQRQITQLEARHAELQQEADAANKRAKKQKRFAKRARRALRKAGDAQAT